MTSRPASSLVSASDVLPTAEILALAKGFAGRACAQAAADAVWVSRATAHTWIDRVPLVALGALVKLCPEVTVFRLARCLGLDPATAPQGLKDSTMRHVWPLDQMADVIVQQIAGGL